MLSTHYRYRVKSLQFQVTFLFVFWWRQLATGRSLKFASFRGGWSERSCPRSATANHSVAVDRTRNLREVDTLPLSNFPFRV